MVEIYFYTNPTPLYRHAVYRDIFTCSFAGAQNVERLIEKMEKIYFTVDEEKWPKICYFHTDIPIERKLS